VRVWTSLTQRPERWQRKNEIADRATANDQDAVHAFTVASALWAVSLLKSKATCVDRPQAGGYTKRRFNIA
jgi:hypothetical protein